jgi:hypothetical protein
MAAGFFHSALAFSFVLLRAPISPEHCESVNQKAIKTPETIKFAY